MPNTAVDNQPLDLTSLTQEQKIQLAITAIQHSGGTLSIRRAATDYGVPRTTLQDRMNGVLTRTAAHAHQQALTPAQESILVDWVKAQGRRGVPLTLATVTDYASDIAGKSVGESWPRRFRIRHPDLAVKMTSPLEECRAAALNPAAVAGFYDILEELTAEFAIPPSNIYNMDEKGIQMGIGSKTAVLVDRNQKTISSIEQGTRDLVTILETVCADGTALHPSVIFEASRRDAHWGAKNPSNAR